MTRKVVFLDRESVDATVRAFDFPHVYEEHDATWTADEIVERLAGAEIALINKVPMRADILKALPDLKMIAVAATGTDVIDKEQAKAQGITISNIRNYAFNTVPEHVIGLMFALRRSIVPYANSVRRGDWGKSAQFCYFDYPIYDIAGSTLGIVGYGALGKSIAEKVKALGMKTIAYDVVEQPGLVDFETILAESDVITLHVPLTPQTKGLFGAEQFRKMKRHALLINTARGGLVDEAALVEALKSGEIGGAGFDVVAQEPPTDGNILIEQDLPNLIVTPHVAWASKEAMQILADQLVDNVEAYVRGATRRSAVNSAEAGRGFRVPLRGPGMTVRSEENLPRASARTRSTRGPMPKKLLFQFDTDAAPSVFDVVVGYDGGADHITGYANVTPDTVGAYVDGTIYTRGGKEKQSTAIFVGGGDMAAGEAVYAAVRKRFFGPFRVSTMLDSNGSNTTAAAGVALAVKAAGGSVKGKTAVVLAGTGPVGMRSAALLAGEGAEVTICGRKLDKTQAAADAINKRFKVAVSAAETPDDASRAAIVKGKNLIFTAGAIGVELLPASAWQTEDSVEIVADYNAQPPAGIGGIEVTDKGKEYGGKRALGALGIGGLKLKLHRACIGKLFESSELSLDAEEIYKLAKEMA